MAKTKAATPQAWGRRVGCRFDVHREQETRNRPCLYFARTAMLRDPRRRRRCDCRVSPPSPSMASPIVVVRCAAPDPLGIVAATRPFHFARDGTAWIQSTGVVVAISAGDGRVPGDGPARASDAHPTSDSGPDGTFRHGHGGERLAGAPKRVVWVLSHASAVTPCLDIEAALTASSGQPAASAHSADSSARQGRRENALDGGRDLPTVLAGAQTEILLSQTAPYLPATVRAIFPVPGVADAIAKLAEGPWWRIGWGGVSLRWADMRLISKGDAGVGWTTCDATHLALLSVDVPDGIALPEVFRWNTKASRAPTPGDPLVLYSHPFSLVNPEMFWGSLGSGVVANLVYAQRKNEAGSEPGDGHGRPRLILTDARYLSGSEGGLVLAPARQDAASTSSSAPSSQPPWMSDPIGMIWPPLCRLDSSHPIPPMPPQIPKTDREREKMREREAIRVQPLEFSLVVPAELVAVALDRAGLGGMVGAGTATSAPDRGGGSFLDSTQTEHSLGASLTPVAPANLAAAAQVERKGHPRLHAPPVPDLFRTMCPMVTVSSARGGTTWASGVLVVGREPATEVYNYMPRGQSNSTESLGPRKAYILTNAHVLLPHLPTNPRGHNRSVGPKLAANAPPPVETNMVKPRDWELGTVRCGARIWLPDGDKGRIRDEQFLHPIFIAPPSSLWDLAVLGPVYLGEDVERMLEWTEAAGNSTGRGLGELVEGCEAAAIGHGVFGPRSDLAPTVSRGILRRVVRIPTEPAALPIQLHSNAAVHNGSSGGPLLALDGGRWKWAGLVCSNLSFTPPGQAAPGGRKFPVKMPSVNFSVPIAVIEPLLKGLFSGDGGAAFARLCSPSALHEPSFSPELELLLDEKHSHFVRSVWSIGFSRMPEEDGEIGRRRKRVRELVEARKRWAEEQERKVDPDQGKPKAKL